jgi:AcrR family transcriptional regulator
MIAVNDVRCTEAHRTDPGEVDGMETPGTGDAARSMALLWRTAQDPGPRPGPRPSLDVDRIVAAAVRLADAEGLATLSMRRVAGELAVAAMTLYGHVPGKGELLDLMLDAVLTELYPDGVPAGNWRVRVEAVARTNWHLYLRHPWAVHLATGGPPLGPNLMRKYEFELRAVDGLGLSDVQMDLLVTLINGFVRGTVGGVHGTVPTDGLERFPTAARVAPVAGAELQGVHAAERSFEFGLERLLDGVGVLVLNPSR